MTVGGGPCVLYGMWCMEAPVWLRMAYYAVVYMSRWGAGRGVVTLVLWRASL